MDRQLVFDYECDLDDAMEILSDNYVEFERDGDVLSTTEEGVDVLNETDVDFRLAYC